MSEVKCPKCNEAFDVVATAIIPENQTLGMRLKCESEMMCAKTVGEAILNMEKLQRAVAKEMGISVAVFIKSIETKSHEIEIRFQIIQTK